MDDKSANMSCRSHINLFRARPIPRIQRRRLETFKVGVTFEKVEDAGVIQTRASLNAGMGQVTRLGSGALETPGNGNRSGNGFKCLCVVLLCVSVPFNSSEHRFLINPLCYPKQSK